MAQENENSNSNNCVFCLIASEKLESYKISEISEAIAVLEINPVSKGHTMVLPKEHLQLKEMKSKIVLFAQKLAAELKEKLNSKDIEIATVDFQGHGIINLIPVYNDENIESKRYKATSEELQEIQNLFLKKPEIVELSKTKEKAEDNIEKEVKSNKKEDNQETKEEAKEKITEKEVKSEKPAEPEKKIWFPRRIP